MKRLFFLLFLLSPWLLPAQSIGGGAIVGLNMGQIDGDLDVGFRQPGLFLGGFLTYPLRDNLNLQPELVFEQLGSRDRSGFFNLRLNYTSLNVLLQGRINLRFNDSSEQSILLEIGPAIGYLVGATDVFLGQDESDIFNRVDLRGVAGGTLQLSSRWGISFRYGYSLFSFLQSNQSNLLNPSQAALGLFHNYMNLSFRYTFIQR